MGERFLRAGTDGRAVWGPFVNALLALLVVVAAQDAQPVSEGPPAPSADSAPATGAVDDTAPAAPQADAPQPDAPQADAPQADAQPGGAQQGDAPPAQAPPAQAPPGATPTPAAPAGPAQTRWEPVDEEVESIATGMLGVCETLILPISIIPAVGEYVGLAAEWACIVPAAFAVQHTALHHGDRAPHLWQIFIALGMQKLWQTIVALPVPFVLVSAATTGLVLGGLAQIFGAPVGITVGLLIAPLTVAYLVSKGLEKEGGRFIFSRMYDLFDEGLRNDEHATAARESWIGPRQDGVAGVVYLVATADGASAPFEPQFLIPVVGPILKAQREAETTRARMRRAGLEVLGERKDDLAGMDTMADVLAGGEALFMAVGHAGLIASFSMLGASLVLSLVLAPRLAVARPSVDPR